MHALLEEGQGVLDGREDIVVGLSSQVLGQVKRNLGKFSLTNLGLI